MICHVSSPKIGIFIKKKKRPKIGLHAYIDILRGKKAKILNK